MTKACVLGALAALFASVMGCEDLLVPADTVFEVAEADVFKDTRVYTPPAPGEGRIYITNSFSDNVSVLDLDKVGSDELAVIATVPVGFNTVEREGPHHLIAAPDGKHYYVGISNFVPGSGSGPHGIHGAGTADGYALKLSVNDNLLQSFVRVDRSPGDIRLTPDGKTLLMSHFDLIAVTESSNSGNPDDAIARLAILDAEKMERKAMVDMCAGGHGIAVAPDSSKAYVSCMGDEVAVVDLIDDAHPVTRVPVIPEPGDALGPICFPYGITMSPSGDAAYVSCFQTGQVRVLDTATNTIDESKSLQLNGGAMFGSFNADGTRAYLAHQNLDGVTIIDPIAGSVVRVIPLTPDVCFNAHVARLTEDEERIMVVCEGDHGAPGTFVVMNAESGIVERHVELGIFPDDIAVMRVPQ